MREQTYFTGVYPVKSLPFSPGRKLKHSIKPQWAVVNLQKLCNLSAQSNSVVFNLTPWLKTQKRVILLLVFRPVSSPYSPNMGLRRRSCAKPPKCWTRSGQSRAHREKEAGLEVTRDQSRE